MIGKIKRVGADILFHCITHHNIHDAIAIRISHRNNISEVDRIHKGGKNIAIVTYGDSSCSANIVGYDKGLKTVG